MDMENYNKDQLYKRHVNLYLEANPNPNSMKFVANFMLFPEGESMDFASVKDAAHSPLATQLFYFDYVNRVFFMNNFITITKSEETAWVDIQDPLKNFIKDYIEADKPLFSDDITGEQEEIQEDSESVKKIKNILEEYVKPAVEQDGGAIIFDSFEKGIVKLQLQGSCSGCPSSTLTLKAGIENLLKSMMPEVEAVEAESV